VKTYVIVAVIAGAICAALAGLAATWKADAACGQVTTQLHAQIATLTAEKAQLELAIAEQNKNVAVAQAKTESAAHAQAQAEQHAAALAAFSKSRMDKLEQFMAETSEQVLKAYWELRK